eukprot:6176213-Pleurochrysis_carterae.AAC.2
MSGPWRWSSRPVVTVGTLVVRDDERAVCACTVKSQCACACPRKRMLAARHAVDGVRGAGAASIVHGVSPPTGAAEQAWCADLEPLLRLPKSRQR